MQVTTRDTNAHSSARGFILGRGVVLDLVMCDLQTGIITSSEITLNMLNYVLSYELLFNYVWQLFEPKLRSKT